MGIEDGEVFSLFDTEFSLFSSKEKAEDWVKETIEEEWREGDVKENEPIEFVILEQVATKKAELKENPEVTIS